MMDKKFSKLSIVDILPCTSLFSKIVKRDCKKLAKNDRALLLGVIGVTLKAESDSILKFRDKLVEEGDADPMTEEQRLMLEMIFRRAFEKTDN